MKKCRSTDVIKKQNGPPKSYIYSITEFLAIFQQFPIISRFPKTTKDRRSCPKTTEDYVGQIIAPWKFDVLKTSIFALEARANTCISAGQLSADSSSAETAMTWAFRAKSLVLFLISHKRPLDRYYSRICKIRCCNIEESICNYRKTCSVRLIR